ncbi:MAG: DUF3160 domain-containing protein, partial [Candidatus Thorarchaeota archaeon]
MFPVGVLRAIDSSTKKKMMTGGLVASMLAVSVVFSLGLYGGIFDGPFNPGPYTPSSGQVFTINETVSTAFADYIPLDEEFTLNSPAYSLAPGLSNVINLNSFPWLTSAQIAMIEQNGFVVVPQNEFDQIYEILEDTEDDNIPVFITSDAVL